MLGIFVLHIPHFFSGRRWHAADLRQKSNNDLHKLWYVLLKEMNMLQTVKAEAKRLEVPMPNPERIMKVQKSMAMIKVVIGERERAIQKLANVGCKAELQEEILHEIDNRESESGFHQAKDINSDQNLSKENDKESNEQEYKNKALVT